MNTLDRIINYVAPIYGLKRHQARSVMYAAAKTHRLTGDWLPVDSDINDIIAVSSAGVRARVRQLVRDFPYFARAVNIMTEYVVGDGIKFQSRIKSPTGEYNIKRSQKVDDAFKYWADEADVSGKLHFYELMALAKMQDVECGEFMLIKRYLNDPKRFIPYCLQILETDWLTSETKETATTKTEQGIEYNKVTGIVTAYYITDPDSWGKEIRIPAEQVIHGFNMLRPGQLRGISPLAPGVLLAKDIQEQMQAEIDASKMASKWLAMITTEDPAFRQIGDVDTDGNKIETLENGIIEYLRPGESVNLASNPRPGANFNPFIRLVLTMFSVTTGVPFELISGDYQNLNYSTARTSRIDFAKALKRPVKRHIRQFCQPAIIPFFDDIVLKNKVVLPNYFVDYKRYQYGNEWQWAGVEAVDPLKETKSDIDNIDKNLRSPQEIVGRRGRDLEELYSEIAAAKKLKEKYGLTDSEVSTALGNSPSKIEDQDKKEDKEDSEDGTT